MMFASLPMYDFQPVAEATAAIWSALRTEILARKPDLDIPVNYARAEAIPDLLAHWCDPALLFSQTCGYPLTHALRGKVRYLATPVYTAPGCSDAGDYCSFLLVRQDAPFQSFNDIRGASFAFNERGSQSGFNTVRWMTQAAAGCDPDEFFSAISESGGHRWSMAMVSEGEADLCAIDCVTYALIARFAPEEVSNLRILEQSPVAPALPYITSLVHDDEMLGILRDSIQAVVLNESLCEARQDLFLKNVHVLPLKSYDRICNTSVA
ncbi:phosphate/phosphite/phosphonate ABC transporter substrate-binding protein [Aestuariispira ectoiniformans]|uniref:phosphate/phosphite/phosphonate ABC transporter substrate-binding protein n=1 Tax=Aestuariispira ectoiniformans TaxID=2775080 RepID=UPI00223AE542|nr:PhnD/SsuA/transferrin family substrate-binding protein [Aestuariispira ectoiniformans]